MVWRAGTWQMERGGCGWAHTRREQLVSSRTTKLCCAETVCKDGRCSGCVETVDNDSLTWDLVYRGLNTESSISILKINCWNISVKHVKLACVVTSSDAVLNFPIRDHLVWISFFLIFSSTHLITVCFCFLFFSLLSELVTLVKKSWEVKKWDCFGTQRWPWESKLWRHHGIHALLPLKCNCGSGEVISLVEINNSCIYLNFWTVLCLFEHLLEL